MLTPDDQSQVQKWLEAEKMGERFPVDFNIAWSMAGYSTKGNAKRRLESELIFEIDFAFIRSDKWSQQGRSSDLINLTCDGFKHFCLMAKTQKGREIRQYFIEVEKAFKKVNHSCSELNRLQAELTKVEKASKDNWEMFINQLKANQYLNEENARLVAENEQLKANASNLEAVKTYLDMINRTVNTAHALTLQTKAIANTSLTIV